MRLLALSCGLLAFSCCAIAQKREKYEFKRNLPVYADSLLKDLTYPMAWGNSPISDFDEWRKTARQKVFDCMLTPPPPAVTPSKPPRGETYPPPRRGRWKVLTVCLPHTLTIWFSMGPSWCPPTHSPTLTQRPCASLAKLSPIARSWALIVGPSSVSTAHSIVARCSTIEVKGEE